MKGLLINSALGLVLFSHTVLAAEPVVEASDVSPKGYIGLGYEHNMVKFPRIKKGELGGLNLEFGQEVMPWLDVAFNVGATGTGKLKGKDNTQPDLELRSNYVISGLIRPKIEPFSWLNLHLTAGYFYRDYQIRIDGDVPAGVDEKAFSKNRYAQGLTVGGGMQIRFAKHHAIQIEYLSYDRSSDFEEGSFDWEAGMVHYQYHW